MFDIKRFGAHISRLRKRADMTQSVLADKLNVTRQAVSRYENGDSFPDVSILLVLSEVFSVTLDDLIRAGNPTPAEEAILGSELRQTELPPDLLRQNITDDIINIAPLLKPSLIDKVARGFKENNIDISKLVTLAEYMNDSAFVSVLESSELNVLDPEVLKRFMPFLGENAKTLLFERILNGELDYHYLEVIVPYLKHVHTLVEAAVVYGGLNDDALRILRECEWVAEDDED